MVCADVRVFLGATNDNNLNSNGIVVVAKLNRKLELLFYNKQTSPS